MENMRLKTAYNRASMKSKRIMAEYLKHLNIHFKNMLQTIANITEADVYFVLEQSIDCPLYYTPTVYICKPRKELNIDEYADKLKRYGVKIVPLYFNPTFKRNTIHYKPKLVKKVF